jgi:hypothetical protein
MVGPVDIITDGGEATITDGGWATITDGREATITGGVTRPGADIAATSSPRGYALNSGAACAGRVPHQRHGPSPAGVRMQSAPETFSL